MISGQDRLQALPRVDSSNKWIAANWTAREEQACGWRKQAQADEVYAGRAFPEDAQHRSQSYLDWCYH